MAAAARCATTDLVDLPCGTRPTHADDIADPHRHPDATTFDGRRLAEERAELELGEFALRFGVASGYPIDDLASRLRSREHTHGRIIFPTLAASQYGFRVCDIAT